MIRTLPPLTGWEPALPQLPAERQVGFFETYWLHFHDPETGLAVGIELVLLSSRNGYRKVAENWIVLFEPDPASGEVRKYALKQAGPLKEFHAVTSPAVSLRSGDSEWSGERLRGSVQSRGRSIEWDLQISETSSARFLIPPELARATAGPRRLTLSEDLTVAGWIQLDGREIPFRAARGRAAHRFGGREDRSWVHLHANRFLTDGGEETDVLLEGFSARGRLMENWGTPSRPAFYLRLRGEEHRFTGWKAWLRCKTSAPNLISWNFDLADGDLRVHGEVRSEYRSFIGLAREDTDGSQVYSCLSLLSSVRLQAYRRGKLEASLHAPRASFEWADRKKNPYVNTLI